MCCQQLVFWEAKTVHFRVTWCKVRSLIPRNPANAFFKQALVERKNNHNVTVKMNKKCINFTSYKAIIDSNQVSELPIKIFGFFKRDGNLKPNWVDLAGQAVVAMYLTVCLQSSTWYNSNSARWNYDQHKLNVHACKHLRTKLYEIQYVGYYALRITNHFKITSPHLRLWSLCCCHSTIIRWWVLWVKIRMLLSTGASFLSTNIFLV